MNKEVVHMASFSRTFLWIILHRGVFDSPQCSLVVLNAHRLPYGIVSVEKLPGVRGIGVSSILSVFLDMLVFLKKSQQIFAHYKRSMYITLTSENTEKYKKV